MKLAAFSAIALAVAAAPAFAQTVAPAPTPGATATAKYSINTPIETIAANPAGKAVLDADFPGMLDHPSYDQFKAMSLNQVQPMSEGQITVEQLVKVNADLAAIK